MFDTGIHQAMSLQHAAGQTDLRVVPVVAHGASETDQHAMWEICFALHALGYPVAVLDGTSLETPDNLGLADLLGDAVWQDRADDPNSMLVVPAARGLRELHTRAASGMPPLHRLRGLLRGVRVLLVYAGATALAPLLEDTDAEPLIFLPPTQQAVVSAYNAFKQMHLQAERSSTLVTVLDDSDDSAMQTQAERVQAAVRSCALTHLGCAPRSVMIRLDQPADLQRVALQLVETAITIDSQAPALSATAARNAQRAAPSAGARRH